VTPTIQGRDFVIATLAAPTVMKEPENQPKLRLRRELKVLKVLRVLRAQQQRVMTNQS
jgi:hypothetical protein